MLKGKAAVNNRQRNCSICTLQVDDAASCPPLKSNPPSKLTVKAQILCEQAARVSQQTTKYALYCKATNNVDSSIKFQNFCSASPSFWQSVCKHNVLFSIRVHKTSNKRLDTIERNRSSRRPMLLHKRTPQGQARR